MVTSMFPINKIHASVLFDTNVDRSFIDYKFRNKLNRKFCNDQIEGILGIPSNCLLSLNNHVFHIDLIPMTIEGFNEIIRMD